MLHNQRLAEVRGEFHDKKWKRKQIFKSEKKYKRRNIAGKINTSYIFLPL